MKGTMLAFDGEIPPHHLDSLLLLSVVRGDSRHKLRQRSSPDQHFPKSMDPGPLLVNGDVLSFLSGRPTQKNDMLLFKEEVKKYNE